MAEPRLDIVQVGGLRMRVATLGQGPLVILCHGFPESWHSWRHQLQALAAAGYRAAAPDMRGYGGTDAPAEVEAYTMLHLVGDVAQLVGALGEKQAVIVGHDWGAPVAWNAALLRPDLFRAVVGMSVEYTPPSRGNLLAALEQQGITTFYMQYFQKPGIAETELEADPLATIRRASFSLSGDAPQGLNVCGVLGEGNGFLTHTIDPEVLPAWLTPEEIAYVAGEFRRTGFRGALNWYRNFARNAELMAAFRGATLRQPALFIAGARDAVLQFPGAMARIDGLPRVLPGLRGSHILEGAGHWVQRERADAVNALLIDFLKTLD
jgi:pimeloyl-ACP methyl ester carboxylesterase